MRTDAVFCPARALLFLVPRAGFPAAVLLAGYLGGAVVTHMWVGEAFFFPVLFGGLFWVALGLRVPGVFRLALGGSCPGRKAEAGDAKRQAAS